MTDTELIGDVGKLYLELALDSSDSEGTARFITNRLPPAQTAAIAQALLNDSALVEQFEIKLPRRYVEKFGLPEEVLTDERATHHRNAVCAKPALLLANTGDDEEQSLALLSPIGVAQLIEHSELWVKVASEGLNLSVDHAKWWDRALAGLFDLELRSLDQIASYVLETRTAIELEGYSVVRALGHALPALQFPRCSDYFVASNEKNYAQASKWKRLYSNVSRKFGCYLRKLTPAQIALNTDDLRKAFKKVRDSIPDVIYTDIEAFIESPSGWNQPAANLAQWEWSDVEPLFVGLKLEKTDLGTATLEFYDDREPGLISQDERNYLERLKGRKTREPEDEDVDFFEQHRSQLKEDRKLSSLWERFIFGAPRECDDFLVGLVQCLEILFAHDESDTERTLTIRCDHRSKRDLRELNIDAGIYFATRYCGLPELLMPRGKVTWDVGHLFKFPELVEGWQLNPKTTINRSTARAALQIKFSIEMESTNAAGESARYPVQLLWRFNPNAVATEFPGDWKRLTQHPLVFCSAHREPLGGKGRFQSVDLCNAKTFVAAFDKDRGSFVGAYRQTHDLAKRWKDNLEEAKQRDLILPDTADKLQDKFDAFARAYSEAIKGFDEAGLAHPCLVSQAQAYGNLLDTLCCLAKGDRCRDLLLKPVIQVGVVSVLGGHRPAAIVTPWNPLRLAATALKAKRIADLIEHLLTAKDIDFGDPRLFFREAQAAMRHPFFPEVVVGWHGPKAEILSLTDISADYSLHELPLADEEKWEDTNENPTEAAERVGELTARYLKLHPHEQANFSVVLYNCDSARLPQAVVDELGALNEEEEDIRCQIVLRHSDTQRLRYLYQKIIESLDSDVDSFNASEATKDFMARLRIGIMVDQAPPPDPINGCPMDIVFLQDVIARHAKLEWHEHDAKPVAIEKLVPSQWSRRRPAAKDDMKSIVFLTCPAQSAEGWAYLTAVTTLVQNRNWNEDREKRLLPSRQLDFQDPKMARIFEETHNLGNWVVNYDELLDRRQLINQAVRVIRYKQSSTQGRNLVISSNAPIDLLQAMVLSRLRELKLGLLPLQEIELAQRFIADANKISGEIVLRAAKRGRNASELIGVVLSSFMIRQELGNDRYYGWYFLDDYADWLGQREEQIADILALSPEDGPDGKRLAIVVSEAKYVLASGLQSKQKESRKQLTDTVQRIYQALFGSPQRLDRDIWLSRFSDLVLNGIEFPATAPIDLSAWGRAVRDGECPIYLRGYSHVFVSGPEGTPDASDFVTIHEPQGCFQEVFSREKTAELVLRYWRGEQPLPLRQKVAEDATGSSDAFRAMPSNDLYRKPGAPAAATPRATKRKSEQRGENRYESSELASDAPPPVPPAINGVVLSDATALEPAQSSVPTSDSAISSPVPSQVESSMWAYPDIDQVLHQAQVSNGEGEAELAWLKQTENGCRGALQQFQLRSKLLSSSLTPNAALLKFQGSADLTVEQVLKRRSEFLTTHKLEIISVRAEPGVVAVAIARPSRRILQLPEVWSRWKPERTGGNSKLLIGVKEEDSSLLFLSPKDNAPHTLIAGSTGSGKSVLMQNIILSIAATNTPAQAKIVIIDPKLGVDYFPFDGLPHLDGGIVEEQEAAIGKLNELVAEMQRRYAVLKQNRVGNLFELNAKLNATERLPFLWVIHDEFADWMMTAEYRDSVTDIVGRLGAKARAAGISLVFAAQRPDANVMPMQLRANLGNRLILRVDGEGTSEIALGEKGAERLLGKGHMAAKLEGENTLSYAQVPYVSAQSLGNLVSTMNTITL